MKTNPSMHLQDIEKAEKGATRDGYGKGMLELGKANKDVVVLSADLTESTRANWFKEAFPDRFIECGVAEQNMMGVAAGLAYNGKIPFACSFSVFSPGRNWDQLRVSVCYSNANVKVGSTHAGLTVGEDGATHQALEDIAMTRCLPNLSVIVPCDAEEARKATIAAGKAQGPFYLRFGREPLPTMTTPRTPFTIGKALTFRQGKDVAIIACGIMVAEALKAAGMLEKEKIDAMIINCHTIKPIDTNTIVVAAKKTGAVVTAEEHQVSGGLGGAVAEVLAERCPVPLERVGVKDTFGESGKALELLEKYGCTAKEIVAAVKKVMKRKE